MSGTRGRMGVAAAVGQPGSIPGLVAGSDDDRLGPDSARAARRGVGGPQSWQSRPFLWLRELEKRRYDDGDNILLSTPKIQSERWLRQRLLAESLGIWWWMRIPTTFTSRSPQTATRVQHQTYGIEGEWKHKKNGHSCIRGLLLAGIFGLDGRIERKQELEGPPTRNQG